MADEHQETSDELTPDAHWAEGDSMGARFKAVLSQIDPTIDWSKVVVASNPGKTFFGLESDDPAIQLQLAAALEKLRYRKQGGDVEEDSSKDDV